MGDSRSLDCVYEVFKATLIDDCCCLGVMSTLRRVQIANYLCKGNYTARASAKW